MIKMVKIALTLTQAKALAALAHEGAEGLLTDKEAAAAYLGGPDKIAAAEAALVLLDDAIRERGRK